MTTQVMEVDDFLEHFGVKGMKWGVHRSIDAGGVARPSRGELRTMNKAARAKNKVDARTARSNRDAEILKARAKIPDIHQQNKAAKQKFKQEKHTIGRVAAKRALDDARNQHIDVLTKAGELTHKEQQMQMWLSIGSAAVSAYAR